MTFQALNAFKVKASVLLALNPVTNESDFAELDIKQRDLSPTHADSFDGTISRRLTESPELPVLETPLTIVVKAVGGKIAARRLAADVNRGKFPNPKDVQSAAYLDGQHRGSKIAAYVAAGADPYILVVVCVCDADEEAEAFLNINGKARRVSPATIDVMLARKVRDGTCDAKFKLRGIASLIAWHLTQKPLASVHTIERPMSRPPQLHTLKFHRTVGTMKELALLLNTDDFRESQAENAASKVSACWSLLYLCQQDTIFGSGAEYCDLSQRDWEQTQVFNIFTEGLVVPVAKMMIENQLQPSQAMIILSAVSNRFMHEMRTHQELVSVRRGFKSLGGASSAAPYIAELRRMLQEFLIKS